MKNNKGITLVALVVTIVVLLILAGVSIAMLSGPNGILTQATTAKTDSASAEAAERINLELQALKAKVLGGKALTSNDATTMQTNLGTGYTVTWNTPTGGLSVEGVPAGVSLNPKGSITAAGVVTAAVIKSTN